MLLTTQNRKNHSQKNITTFNGSFLVGAKLAFSIWTGCKSAHRLAVKSQRVRLV